MHLPLLLLLPLLLPLFVILSVAKDLLSPLLTTHNSRLTTGLFSFRAQRGIPSHPHPPPRCHPERESARKREAPGGFQSKDPVFAFAVAFTHDSRLTTHNSLLFFTQEHESHANLAWIRP